MINRVELTKGVMHNVHCPFCGSLVLDLDFTEDKSANPCEHTLFVAHDYEVEYLSDSLKKMFNVSLPDQLEDLDGFNNIDSFTDKIDLKNAIKFAQYEGAPGDTGVYVGFQLGN